MTSIFVSYRRSDSRADAGRLYDRLSEHFGDGHVFMDVDDIEPGQDFPKVLDETLKQCNVLLVLIGPRWLTASSPQGQPRLQDPGDYVRMELSHALERGIMVIPVLVGDAAMPGPESLPEELRGLCRHQALRISHDQFHPDVDALVLALEGPASMGSRLARAFRRRRLQLAILVILLGVLLVVAVVAPLMQRAERQRQVETHLKVAQAFVAEDRLHHAIAEYRQALRLAPRDVALYRGLIAASVDRLQREAFVRSSRALDVGLNAQFQRLQPVPDEELDAALRDLFVLAALDPALEQDPDHLLTKAMVLKTSGSRVREALAVLQRAHELAPEHAGVLSELGLMRSVVMADAGGLSLLRQAAAIAPVVARIQFYLARGLSELHACNQSTITIAQPDAQKACAEALRGYYQAAATGDMDLWSRHIRSRALDSMLDILKRYATASGSIVDIGLPLDVQERVAMLELVRRAGAARARGNAENHPLFWLTLLYETNGQREQARVVLRELMDGSNTVFEVWKRVAARLGLAED